MICPLCDAEIVEMYGRDEVRRLADHLLDLHEGSVIAGGTLHCHSTGDAVRCWCGWVKGVGERYAERRQPRLAQVFAEHLAAHGGVAHLFDLMLGTDP